MTFASKDAGGKVVGGSAACSSEFVKARRYLP